MELKKIFIIVGILVLLIIAATVFNTKGNNAHRWFKSDSILTVKYMNYLNDHESDSSDLAIKEQMPENEETLIAYAMAGMGYWNTARNYPGLKAECVRGLEKSIDTLMSDFNYQLLITCYFDKLST